MNWRVLLSWVIVIAAFVFAVMLLMNLAACTYIETYGNGNTVTTTTDTGVVVPIVKDPARLQINRPGDQHNYHYYGKDE